MHSRHLAKVIQYVTHPSQRSNIRRLDRSQIISGLNIIFARCIGYAENTICDVFESVEEY
jgi:hypothetical protein